MIIKYSLLIFVMCFLTDFLFVFDSANAYEFPPYEGLNFRIEGSISGNYSNNITYAKDREDRIEQFTTMLVLGLGVTNEGKRRSLRFSGQMRQPVRVDSSDVRNSSEILTLNIVNEFSEYDRIRINNVFTHTKVPSSFRDNFFYFEECERLLLQFGIEAVRNDPRCSEFDWEFGRSQGDFETYRNDFRFNYSRDISDQFSVAAGYDNNIYDSSEEMSNDSIRNSFNVNLNYKVSYATYFFLSYTFADTSYDRGDNISTDSIRAGINQYITKRLLFRGSIGMVFTPTTDSTSFDALLKSEIDERTHVSIDFSRDINTAADRGDIFRNWQIRGNLRRVLSEDMGSFLAVFYGEGDFVSDDVTDRLAGVSISLDYNFWQHKRGARITGQLGYTYSNLNSTDENRGYNRSTINSSLTIAF